MAVIKVNCEDRLPVCRQYFPDCEDMTQPVDKTSIKGIFIEVLKWLAILYCTQYTFENAVGGSQFQEDGG